MWLQCAFANLRPLACALVRVGFVAAKVKPEDGFAFCLDRCVFGCRIAVPSSMFGAACEVTTLVTVQAVNPASTTCVAKAPLGAIESEARK